MRRYGHSLNLFNNLTVLPPQCVFRTQFCISTRRMSTATHRSLSIDEFVDHFENAIKEKQSLEARLAKALDEIETLRAQLQPDTRLKSLLALKEKLIRDEFEMKYRDLQVQVKQMRTQYTRQVEEMKAQMKGQLSTCICHGAGLR